MTVVFIFYLFLSFWWAVAHPKWFFVFYILASTKFLGFFDAEALFVFNGLGLATPGIHIIIFIVLIIRRHANWIPNEFKFFSRGVLILLAFGVITPVLFGFESFFQAIMASKQFWCIGFFLYMVRFRKRLQLKFIRQVIILVGIYISLAYAISFLINVHPPYYFIENKFRAYYPTYISLAWFFVYLKSIAKKIGNVQFMMYSCLFLIGLVLAGHFALTISTLFFIIFNKFILRGQNLFSFKTIFRSVLGFCLLSYFVLSSEDLTNGMNSILSGDDIALSSRESYNLFRWNAINDSPYFGYGFIHKSSSLTEAYGSNELNRFTERFEVIDSGYVDILIKFGFLGLIFILYLWLSPILPIIFYRRYCSLVQLVSSLYIFQYVLVNYTWSVFTYMHGLIPGFIGMFTILYCNEIYLTRNNVVRMDSLE